MNARAIEALISKSCAGGHAPRKATNRGGVGIETSSAEAGGQCGSLGSVMGIWAAGPQSRQVGLKGPRGARGGWVESACVPASRECMRQRQAGPSSAPGSSAMRPWAMVAVSLAISRLLVRGARRDRYTTSAPQPPCSELHRMSSPAAGSLLRRSVIASILAAFRPLALLTCVPSLKSHRSCFSFGHVAVNPLMIHFQNNTMYHHRTTTHST